MKRRRPRPGGKERRRLPSIGAHPERRSPAPVRRAALRRRHTGPVRSAVVLPPVVNMRERAEADSPVVSQATLGTTVGVLDSKRGWDLVETQDRYRGWIRSAALAPRPPGDRGFPRAGRGCRVRTFMAQVYRERDVTTASPLTTAPLLSLLEVETTVGEWLSVRLPDGRRGFLQSGDVEPLPPPADPAARRPIDGAAVAATALRFLGLPYVWGGTTPFGLDCSGLAQLVYRLHGHLLPRDADLQHAHTALRPVERAALLAGDLVFFGPAEGSIAHVGVALDRDEFVSATTYRSPTVRVDRLDDPYWLKLYRGARRLRAGG